MRRALVGLALGTLAALAGCATTPDESPVERAKADEVAQAFTKYVHEHYRARLATEIGSPPPPASVLVQMRRDLERALADAGVTLPEKLEEGAALRQTADAVRRVLLAHDYVFLPLVPEGEAEGPDLGIALAHVRERRAAQRREIWGREVRYKLVIYEPLLREYPAWKARALGTPLSAYSSGRFSSETVYVDHEQAVERAKALPPAYAHLGLPGVLREVELRQVAYLAFAKEVPEAAQHDPEVRRAALTLLHERVLWTAVRYGDPQAALADVQGLARNDRVPYELREAARRVRDRLPLLEKPTEEELHRAAGEAWEDVGRR